jgi:hypothetical protein
VPRRYRLKPERFAVCFGADDVSLGAWRRRGGERRLGWEVGVDLVVLEQEGEAEEAKEVDCVQEMVDDWGSWW